MDRQTVSRRLPRNTVEMTVSGVTGWRYKITCQLGNSYTMFIYFDKNHSLYQVMVAFPEVAGHYNVHDAHLFGDGRICLDAANGGGMSNLEQAFAKSSLWANGFTIYQKTGRFPFSKNNL